MKKFLKFILFTTLFLVFVKPVCFAGVEPYENFIKGKIKPKDTIIVKDEKFKNSKYNWSDITNISVKDFISFRILDSALIKQKFSAQIRLKVEYLTDPDASPQVKNIDLNINYALKKGVNYKINDSYNFTGAYWIRVTVVSIYSPEFGYDPPPYFQLSANIVINRQYKFNPKAKLNAIAQLIKNTQVSTVSKSGAKAPASTVATSKLNAPAAVAQQRNLAVENTSPGTISNNSTQLQLTWPTIGAEYDIEWTTADAGNANYAVIQQMAAGTAGTVDTLLLNSIFLHNATRITTSNQSYLLSLPYNDDYVLVRMRQVAYSTDGVRLLGSWDYQLGSGQYAVWALTWYEQSLNWQYSAAFAEEGKKKEVVSYFDGSLRSRQTVTINNSDNVALFQENIYDDFGRATASILPAPYKEASGVTPYLRYFPNFNTISLNTSYSYANVVGSTPSTSCEYNPDSLSITSGASQYYSAQNTFINDQSYDKYIPNGQGYPISVTQYTPDNTGRIMVQGGVGKTFQPGRTNPSYTTKYFYAIPSQWELDRIFGNDVGNYSHYLKNMVVDPNGQVSISYLNASGKTIATALSGNVPNKMDSISTILPAVIEKIGLLDSAQFVFDSQALTIKGTATYLATQSGKASMTYSVQKLIDQYPGGAQAMCSNCFYDLTINVYNDCDQLVYNTTTPIQVGSMTANCSGTGIQKDSIPIVFPQIGEYYFTFQLGFSKTVMENYVSAFAIQGLQNGYLKNNFSFILPYLNGINYKACLSDCSTCEQTLGTQTSFVQTFQTKLLGLGVDSATVVGSTFQTWANTEYTTLKAYCDSLSTHCNSLSADSIANCSQYETPMLADVSPGGQYALFDSTYNALEIPSNVIYNNWRTVFPVLSSSSTQYQANLITLPDGSITSPYDVAFTLPMLVQYWNPSWANSFLPYHPEYCKLQFCYINNTSETWDQEVQNITSAAAIPTIPGAPTGLAYSYTNAGWLVAADPFFQSGGLGAAYASNMQSDLQNYSTNVLGVTAASNKSLTAFVDFLTYCSDPNANTNGTISSFNNWDNCTPLSACRVPDREWGTYQDYYFALKQTYYNKVRAATTCNNTCSVGAPLTLPNVSPCPAITDFIVDNYGAAYGPPVAACANTMKMVVLSYNGGKVTTPVTVTIGYSAGVNSAGLPTTFQYAVGDSTKTFCIPSSAPIQAVTVQSIVCQACQANPLLFGTWQSNVVTQVGDGLNTLFKQTQASYTNGEITINPDNTYSITGTCALSNGTWNMDDSCRFSLYSNDIKYTLVSVTSTQLQLTHKEGPVAETWVLNNVGSTPLCSSPVTLSAASVAAANSYYTGAYPSRHLLTVVPGTAGTQPPFNCVNSAGGSGSSVATFYTCLNVVTAAGITTSYSNVWVFNCVYDSMPSTCPPVLAIKTPRFYDNVMSTATSIGGSTASLQQQTQDGTTQQVQSSVSSEADGWMTALSSGLSTYSASTVAALRAALIDIASKGGDQNHPFGASSVAPGQTTASGYLSFGDAIKGILGLSSFTNKLNPWLISAPYPYSPLMQGTEPGIANSNPAICALLQTMQTQCNTYNATNGGSLSLYSYLVQTYGAAMNISTTDFAALQNSCGQCQFILGHDITLPVFLQPGAQGCILPSDYAAAKTAFNAQFATPVTSADSNYEAIYANFMNQRYGFVLGYADYYNYDNTLTTNPSAILCNQIGTNIPPDPLACIETQISVAVGSGDRDYDTYLQAQENLFRASYVSTCSAAKPLLNLYAPQKIYHYTLYYYDQADNLLATVPPEGVQLLTDAQITAAGVYRTQYTATDTATVSPVYPTHRLFTTYAYNSTNQVTQQSSPDGGTNIFWYDLLSRLVISQNAVQLPANNYSYTTYDVLGRITEVGQKNQTTINLGVPDYLQPTSITGFYGAGTNTQITDTYYDTPTAATNGMQAVTQTNLRKRVAASTYRDTQAGQVQQATYYNYDLDGNVSTLYQQIAGLGLKQINYEYDLISGKVNFVSYQNGQPDQFYYLYNYDADNRLTEAWSGTSATIMPNGGSYLDNGKMDASYKYYLHGPLARMELGDVSSKLQGVDYAYTLQGWHKGVNSTVVNTNRDMGADGNAGINNVSVDAYGYTLYYYPNDYTPIAAAAQPFETVLPTFTTFNPLYNGNIAGTAMNIPQLGSSFYYYTHQYDQLNRLTHSEIYTATGAANTGVTHTNNYKEYFTYDGNGNIQTTFRNGNTLNGNQLVMDQLTYGYNRDANGKLLNNQLNYIGDAAPASNYTNDLKNQNPGNYQYDAKGDLTADQQAGVSNIQWTVYNKIQSLANSSGTINYTYDPAGERATKTVAGITTYYIRDAQGNTLATYDNSGGATNWREQDLYGSSRLGMWTPNMKLSANNAQTIWDTLGHKNYELTNHLENIMVTISNKRIAHSTNGVNIDYYLPDITTAQQYYAFGSLMPNLTYTENNNYKYGFNGKENDNEVKGVGDQQDYGMRIYDPRAGKFLSVDPIGPSYPWYTGYSFAGNNPILNLDLDGEEEFHYTLTVDKQGKSLLKLNSIDPNAHLNILGFDIKTHLTLPRYVVNYNGNTYHIGFASYPINNLKAPQFKQFLKNPSTELLENNFNTDQEENGYSEINAFETMMVSSFAVGGHINTINTHLTGGDIITEMPDSPPENRGLIYVLEDPSKRSTAAQDYENGVIGATSDVETRKRLVPALKYDNPNPNGKNFVKFDGYDEVTKTLVDRKLNVTTFEKALDQLRRMSEAFKQNPTFKGVIEVPNQAVYNRAVTAFEKAGVNMKDITIKIAQ
ncbi:RHS repeat-associated core domain-containing protein [Mucilaginibacter sp. X4EP1]|uniref:RHS repeat-associated core domain-containing protein n=1 Tax=Mucilaginibacter sp. X4EP1 TaxID=2723092 RepID=UPI00216AABC8|nr:RHS repeat-associated core domain-containing protein [Mucilaginibacter sp. X4EP1]MCS3814668.1 RHS repeat-associated protein [Mucilaginibacter sp. X4EP1]